MSETLRNLHWHVTVTRLYRGVGVSPITGRELIAYGETVEEARQRVDLLLLRECVERGITIVQRTAIKDAGAP